jgi:ribose 5-phosphate isomerase A
MLSPSEIKKRTGAHAATLVEQGMIVGLGTGSTAEPFIKALAVRVKDGLSITGVPTSSTSKKLAEEAGITLVSLNDVAHIDLTIDGADEIDERLQLIKGGGGALLQEKMVAFASKQLIIVADHTKLVTQLGKFPLPIEVVPYGWKQVQRAIQQQYNISVVLREKEGDTFITDHGHYILDCHFAHIDDAPHLDTMLHAIPGVAGTGLFIKMASAALIGYPDGEVRRSIVNSQ